MDDDSFKRRNTASDELKKALAEHQRWRDPLGEITKSLGGTRQLRDALASVDALRYSAPNISGLAETGRALTLPKAHLADLSAVSEVMKRVGADHALAMKQLQGVLGASQFADRIRPDTATSELAKSMALISKSISLPDMRFGIMASKELERTILGIKGSLGLADSRLRSIADQLAAISKPWTAIGYEASSVAAAMNLARFSDLTTNMQVFSPERLAVVDMQFGRFDTSFAVAEAEETEEAGEAVYTAAGRNPALVAFPSGSFDEILSATGWAYQVPTPDVIRADGTIVLGPTFDPHDHYIITMIEAHLRALIIQTLGASGGIAVLKQILNDRLKIWEQKQADWVTRGGEPLHPLYFSDFMDLHDIVINGKLWKSSFVTVFRSKEMFSVTMQRLHAIRIQTGHSKPLSMTARLRLWVEGHEIFQALGIASLPN